MKNFINFMIIFVSAVSFIKGHTIRSEKLLLPFTQSAGSDKSLENSNLRFHQLTSQ